MPGIPQVITQPVTAFGTSNPEGNSSYRVLQMVDVVPCRSVLGANASAIGALFLSLAFSGCAAK